MKITMRSDAHLSSTTYAGSQHGLDLYLTVKNFGTIYFDSPEEAEEIAGAILAGLQKERLPRRHEQD